MLVQVYDLFNGGQPDAAEDLFDRYLPLNRYEQQLGFGLPVRKEILRRRGALRHGAARRPVNRLSATEIDEIDRLMARAERGQATG